MLRERSAGTYQISAYFLAKSIGDMILQVVAPIVFTCIVYNRIGRTYKIIRLLFTNYKIAIYYDT